MVDVECGLIVWPIMKFILFCFILFLKHKSRLDLTSHWDPQVKLIGKGLAEV
jgi:hypothetical protein